jgi:signal transduction histidine kinase
MKRRHTIGSRLTASFLMLFCVLTGFGVFGLMRLEAFNDESIDIRDRWLKSTRYLGDLNNFTSDFRALEAAYIISPPGSFVLAKLAQEKDKLDAEIALSQSNFEKIPHSEAELEQYRGFQRYWRDYRAAVDGSLASLAAKDTAGAIGVYLNVSHKAFSQATEQLDQLSNINNEKAQEAGARAGEAIREAGLFIRAAIALSCAAVLTILIYITRKVSLPLRDLSRMMRRLSAGDMDVEITGIDRNDELGEMARAVSVFRANAVELRISQCGLASQASMLEERLAHERLLSQQQRNFISMASHEFRTPMALIDGHAQRLINSNDSQSTDPVVTRARKIRVAIKRMSAMIDGLLHSCKLVDMDPELYFHPKEFDIRALLHEVCKLHREISPSSMIYEDLGYHPLRIYGDRALLFQLFSNLVANAVKYSPGGGTIRLAACAKGALLVVTVKDEGIGIPKSDLDRLFERYYRGGNVAGIVGTGLGLFLAKIVVELHDGAIEVESVEGGGSCFTISLPYALKDAEAANIPLESEAV